MKQKIKVLVIIGSASGGSSNLLLIKRMQQLNSNWDLMIWDDLSVLPHFDPELAVGDSPSIVRQLRAAIENADGVRRTACPMPPHRAAPLSCLVGILNRRRTQGV